MIDKDKDPTSYRKGIYLCIFSLLSLLLTFYFYSMDSSPGKAIFISHSLYFFAETVLFIFCVCILLFIVGVIKIFFSKKYYESNPSRMISHIQWPFESIRYRSIFVITSIAFFYSLEFSLIFLFFSIMMEQYSLYSQPINMRI